jgi:hypothetical protein
LNTVLREYIRIGLTDCKASRASLKYNFMGYLALITVALTSIFTYFAQAEENASWKSCESALKHLTEEMYRIARHVDSIPTEKVTLAEFDQQTTGSAVKIRRSDSHFCPKVSVEDMPVSLRDQFSSRMEKELNPKLNSDQLLREAQVHVQKSIQAKVRGLIKVRRPLFFENNKRSRH